MKKTGAVDFDLIRVPTGFRRTFYALVFGCLAIGVASCGPHYVAQIPAAGVEIRPASPYAGAFWVDGEWGWRGGRHAYTNGYWTRPRAGKTYRAGEWRHNERGHYWVGGRWN